LYGGYLAINGGITTGELFAFVFLVQYLIEPLTEIPQMFSQVRVATAAHERIRDVLDLPEERVKGLPVQDPSSHDVVIECKDISFQYSEVSPVLQSVSFRVLRNQTIAIVGSSGAGKSTIFQLLCGHHQPQDGAIYFCGEDMQKLNLEEVRSRISIVSQDTFLFPDTIFENISYGNPDAAMEDIVSAAKAAFIHDFIMTLPDGYQTMIGERGIRLSGGQKQRVSIARAFLKKAPVLLFDEATSALDTESETSIQRNLSDIAGQCTMLVIAHRLSTIINADEIIVLHEGRIVERGSHPYLLEHGSRYRQLYRQQFLDDTRGLSKEAI
jgi:ABC-type multidrug transport system fused ATPase/permease subunit